eukprot:Clim_evm16s169 gene=Clim_evmTU16s169
MSSSSATQWPKYPLLYQVNLTALFADLEGTLGMQDVTLATVPDTYWQQIADWGFHYVYLLGLWQTGPAAVEHSERVLEDSKKSNAAASPFAVIAYDVSDRWGGVTAYRTLRQKLQSLGLAVIVDFVPNHVGIDHPWVKSGASNDYIFRPDNGESLHQEQPQNFFSRKAGVVCAHGKDPFFDGWKDTAQLDYSSPSLQREMTKILKYIAELADGVRCDMAMLVTDEVFTRTWSQYREDWIMPYSIDSRGEKGAKRGQFWERAIPAARDTWLKHKSLTSSGTERETSCLRPARFIFVAEVYWDMEFTLQQQGFDYCYDKTLYDRLVSQSPGDVSGHLSAEDSYQAKLCRFLENHDEPRAAAELGSGPRHLAAALVTYTGVGMRFFHDGQIEGRRVQLSMHERMRSEEQINGAVFGIYSKLIQQVLARPECTHGEVLRASITASSDGNPSYRRLIGRFVGMGKSWLLVLVNYSDSESNGHVVFPEDLDLSHGTLNTCRWQQSENVILVDQLEPMTVYERNLPELQSKGLWVSLQAWHSHVFELRRT